MKQRHKIQIICYILGCVLLLEGCIVNTKHFTGTSASASVAPSGMTAPTPTPNTEAYIEAYQNYTSDAGVAAVYDTSTKIYYYAKQDITTKIYPASTTKLLTAYVALEYLTPEEMITAGDELDFVASDASVAQIKKGYTLSVEALIEGMLLPSGNDAAYIVACAAGRRIAGNSELSVTQAVKLFVDEMNRQALQLGLTGSHFISPDGYHNQDHYTTVEDLIYIATLALSNTIISKYIQTAEETVALDADCTVVWKNTNLLLHRDSPYYTEDAVGLKTGYTKEAGYVLLSAFRNRDSSAYTIILVAKCATPESRFQDTLALYKIIQDIDAV